MLTHVYHRGCSMFDVNQSGALCEGDEQEQRKPRLHHLTYFHTSISTNEGPYPRPVPSALLLGTAAARSVQLNTLFYKLVRDLPMSEKREVLLMRAKGRGR